LTGDAPPIRLFGPYLRERYGERVGRLCLDAGLGCPNRDGTLSREGCTFCREESYSRAAERGPLSIGQQIKREKEIASRRHKAGKFIAYLQPGTNTHGALEDLRRVYDECAQDSDVVALAVGTRPDCLPRDVVKLLAAYRDRGLDVWVELGLQSSNDRTLARMHRNHTFADYVDAACRARAGGLLVAAHLIAGLPGEGPDDWRRTAEELARLRPDGVKLHHLQIVRGTPLETAFRRGEAGVLQAGEYVAAACDVLERLPSRTVVMRLVGETRGDWLVGPDWGIGKQEVLRAIEAEFRRRGTGQGALCGIS